MKYICIILVMVVVAGCNNKKQPENTTMEEKREDIIRLSDEQLKSFIFTTTSLKPKNISGTIRLNGKAEVSPQNLISVSNALGGYVKTIHLLPGTYFKKGEILAVLEDNQFIELQQDYLTVKAQLAYAEQNYQRQKELNENKAASDKTFQVVAAEYQTLKVSEKALEEKLRLINIDPVGLSVNTITRSINIYASFNGVVSQVFVNMGKYVSPSDVLFELINPDDLLLNLKVFEKDLSRVSVGQTLRAYTNENPGQYFEAEVITTGRTINADGTANIHAQLKNPATTKIVAGMYVNAYIETLKNEVYVLPEVAVVTFEGQHYVFEVLDNNTFKLIAVEVGISGEGFVEISNNESLRNKTFVAEGAYTLLMGLKNKPEE